MDVSKKVITKARKTSYMLVKLNEATQSFNSVKVANLLAEIYRHTNHDIKLEDNLVVIQAVNMLQASEDNRAFTKTATYRLSMYSEFVHHVKTVRNAKDAVVMKAAILAAEKSFIDPTNRRKGIIDRILTKSINASLKGNVCLQETRKIEALTRALYVACL